MLRVGLTGGLATGKTHVGKTLERLGCHLIQADLLGHQVLEPDGPAFAPTVEAFGPEILREGRIDRQKLGSFVFADPEKLARLNAIVHPLVFQLEDAEIARLQKQDPNGIVVLEAAILIETGSYKRCDKLILTVCSEEEQIKRATSRDGMTEHAARERLARQMSLAEKRRFANYIIDTSGTFEATEEQTRDVYLKLRSLTP